MKFELDLKGYRKEQRVKMNEVRVSRRPSITDTMRSTNAHTTRNS